MLILPGAGSATPWMTQALRAADAPAKPADTSRLMARQSAEAQKLLAQYRQPATTADQRGQIVEQLLELGQEGPRQLAAQAQRDFASKGPAYLAKFEKSAGEALRARWKGKDVEKEVGTLRQTVLEVSHAADLTKEMIVSRADPAMGQLEQWMSVTAENVLATAAGLKDRRAEVLEALAIWHRAADRLPEGPRKKLAALPEAEAFEKELSANEELAAGLATPMTPADRAVMMANLPAAKSLDAEEARGILALNLIRLRLGLGALAIDPRLCEAARGHSKDMRERKFFAHDSPVPGKETPWKRAEQAGTSASAENIFLGSASGEAAIAAWWHSPGHHKNMTGAHRRVGLGRSESHWTQMFGQ